jgi:predicted dehydrogenase
MAQALRWGILGTGRIAARFAQGLHACGLGMPVAAGSRDLARAQAFTDKFGGKPLGSYEAVLADPQANAVYIALPHHLHAEWTARAADAGRHVLCEKPFALNVLQAEKALAHVRQANVFCMEAFMYRAHPQTVRLIQTIKRGSIGKPVAMHVEFGYAAPRDGGFRHDPALGGGALMDAGCYPVSLARLVAGSQPTKAVYFADTQDGYDSSGAGAMEFPSGLRATFACSIHARMANQAVIYGESGRIVVESPWFCDGRLLLYAGDGQEPQSVGVPKVADLWGNQAILVAEYLEKRQCPAMTWNDTMGNLSVLDALRRQVGLRFAGEE